MAPRDVPIFFQDEQLPGVMGQVRTNPFTGLSIEHVMDRHPLIEAKIRELYDLEPRDRVRSVPGEVHENLIKYEVYQARAPGNVQVFIRPKKAVGGRRKTRRSKRKARQTRRLKPRRHI